MEIGRGRGEGEGGGQIWFSSNSKNFKSKMLRGGGGQFETHPLRLLGLKKLR